MTELTNRIADGPLITTDWPNRYFNFYSYDSKDRFNRNSKDFISKNEPWIYLDKHIDYKFNNQGYRTLPWEDINWQESIVIFGCSIVLGEGLAEEDTISAQLSKLTNRPVINLGVSGTGILFNFYNSIMLHKNLPTPYAVVHVWPESTRIEVYSADTVLVHVPAAIGYDNSPEGKFKDTFFRSWIMFPENPNTHVWFSAQASRALWQNKTKYYEISMNAATSKILDCDFVEKIDFARDLGHPGITTAKNTATEIFNNLNRY